MHGPILVRIGPQPMVLMRSLEPTQWRDRDFDGYGDNQSEGANLIDDFPDNPTQFPILTLMVGVITKPMEPHKSMISQ